MNLSGKVAMVTGGARGIGAAISRALAIAGADLLIADLRQEDAQATACRLHKETGRRVEAQGADVTRLEDMQAAAEAAADRFGGVDVLVNNAGWDRLLPFLKSTPELWDRTQVMEIVRQDKRYVIAGGSWRQQRDQQRRQARLSRPPHWPAAPPAASPSTIPVASRTC